VAKLDKYSFTTAVLLALHEVHSLRANPLPEPDLEPYEKKQKGGDECKLDKTYHITHAYNSDWEYEYDSSSDEYEKSVIEYSVYESSSEEHSPHDKKIIEITEESTDEKLHHDDKIHHEEIPPIHTEVPTEVPTEVHTEVHTEAPTLPPT